jgi:hypothetical protein
MDLWGSAAAALEGRGKKNLQSMSIRTSDQPSAFVEQFWWDAVRGELA